MGLLANIFGGNKNTKQNRQRNRKLRVSRIEELESRDMLTATPFSLMPPPVFDPVDFSAIFHDSSDSAVRVDTFTITWKGGEAETRMTELVIDLGGATIQGTPSELFFVQDTFQYDGVQDAVHHRFEDGKLIISLTQAFYDQFADNDEYKLVFQIAVDRVLPNGDVLQSVPWDHFAGASITVTFESPNFYKFSQTGYFGNVQNPDPDNFNDNHTAGLITTWSAPAPKTGTLSGTVYEVINANDKKNTDAGIPGMRVELWKWNSENERYEWTGRYAVTDENGDYKFTGVAAFNKYKIIVVGCAESNLNCWFASVGEIDNGSDFNGIKYNANTIKQIIMQGAAHGQHYNFAKYQGGTISGVVYVDMKDDNGVRNGIFDGGDKVLGGVTVILWRLNERTGEFEIVGETKTIATGEHTGHYAFVGLRPGTYKVEVRHPEKGVDGWNYKCWVVNAGEEEPRFVGDLDKIKGIVITSGAAKTNFNFGKKEKSHVCPPCDCTCDCEPCDCDCTPCTCKPCDCKCDCEPKVCNCDDVCDCCGHCDCNGKCTCDEKKCTCDGCGCVDCNCGGDCNCPKEGGDTHHHHHHHHHPGPSFNNSFPNFSWGSMPAPVGGGGAFAAPGVGMWQAPSISGSMLSNFGSGGGAMAAAASAAFAWNLSVINAGYPRANASTDGIAVGEHASITTMLLSDGEGVDTGSGARYVSVSWSPMPMNQSGWYIRGADGIIRKRFTFGPDGGTPVVGDFAGDGIARIAVFHEGNWYIDINGNGVWDEEDLWIEMGSAADQPVVGDWDGDGKTDIGVFGPMRAGDAQILAATSGLPTDLNATVSSIPKNMPPNISIDVAINNARAMKHSQTGGVRLDVVDHVFQFGGAGDQAFVGDFTGDGISTIGIYRDGKWYIDKTGTGQWNANAVVKDNADYGLGPEGIPVAGDWTGDGIDKIGLFVDGTWYLDTTGDFRFDTQIRGFGQAGDRPVVGDFDGTGIAQLAVYRASIASDPLIASTVAPVVGTGAGMVAQEFGANSQPSQEELQHQGRSITTPHTSAPLERGR